MTTRMSLAALALVVAGVWFLSPAPTSYGDDPPKTTPVPVDTSMHDFMEGVFQGPYRRLKPAIAAEPKDNAGWKVVRSEALILAEGGNLLLLRKPEKEGDKWAAMSVAVRDAGAELVQAARMKDFAGSRKAYEKMIDRCNACHQHFDGGKHQLDK
jgi:hypothetical protein